jgi:hypothetical protein
MDVDGSGNIELGEVLDFMERDIEDIKVRRGKKIYYKRVKLPEILTRTATILHVDDPEGEQQKRVRSGGPASS